MQCSMVSYYGHVGVIPCQNHQTKVQIVTHPFRLFLYLVSIVLLGGKAEFQILAQSDQQFGRYGI